MLKYFSFVLFLSACDLVGQAGAECQKIVDSERAKIEADITAQYQLTLEQEFLAIGCFPSADVDAGMGKWNCSSSILCNPAR